MSSKSKSRPKPGVIATVAGIPRPRAITTGTPKVKIPVYTQNQKKRSLLYRSVQQASSLMPLLVFLLVGFFPWLILPNGSSQFSNFLNIFLGLTIEALPFLLLGALVAAALAVWGHNSGRLESLWKKMARNRTGAAVAGIGLGFALPVCECGTASIARQTTRQGAPVVMSMIFLLAAPIINPVTILVTWIAFNGEWSIVLGRVSLALVVAVAIGLFFSLHPRPDELFNSTVKAGKSNNGEADCRIEHSHSKPEEECSDPHHTITLNQNVFRARLRLYLNRSVLEFLQATKVALPGIALASAFQAYLSPRFFLELGQGALLSAVALMLIATLMAVCSSVDAFVALSFAGLFPAGSILAFLVFGPLINLKSLFLLRLVLNRRTIWLMTFLCFQIVLLVAVFINLHSS